MANKESVMYRFSILFLLLGVQPSLPQSFVSQREIVLAALPTSGGFLPRYGSGFSVAISPDRYSLTLFGKEGQSIYFKYLKDSDGVVLRVIDVAVSPAGGVVASATALRPDGATASVLAFLGPTGEIQRLVQSDGFAARKIRFARDKELWALGLSKSSTADSNPSQHLLRVYDDTGRLVREVLPLADLAGEAHPYMNSLLVPYPNGMAVLVPGLARLYVYESGGTAAPRVATIPWMKDFEVFTAALPNLDHLYLQGVMPSPDQPRQSIPVTLRLSPFAASPLVQRLAGPPTAIMGLAGSELVLYAAGRLQVGGYTE